MLHSSLDRPNDPFALPEPGYSPLVEHRLIAAYRCLATNGAPPNTFVHAYNLAFQCLGQEMSVRQSMRVYYVLGSALIADGAEELGIEYIQQAMAAAASLNEWLAWIELTYLAGSAKASALRYADAISYYSAGLSATQDALGQDGEIVTDLECSLLLGTAYAKYLLGDLAAAARLLRSARGLSASSLIQERASGTLYWMEALVLRWDSQPEEALICALKAQDTYKRATTPTEQVSYGRLQSVITDIALDVVERLPAGTSRDALLSFAKPLAKRAAAVARPFDDVIGTHLATLAQARWNRLAGRNVATHEAIWKVVGAAEDIGDAALLAQAHTALGHDLLAHGWRDAGLDCYRRTMRVIGGTQIPAMGKWARDKLFEASKENG